MNLEYCRVLQGGLYTKTDKNTASVFRVFDLLYIQIKPYESELSTALSECKAVAQCAIRKTDTAINRIKTSETHKLRIENTSGRKQNKNRWGSKTVVTSRNIDTAITIPVIYFIRSKADYLANQRGNPLPQHPLKDIWQGVLSILCGTCFLGV